MCCVAVKIAAIIYYAQLVRCYYTHYAHLVRSMIRVGKIGTPCSQSWTVVLLLSVPTTLLALTLRFRRGCLGSNDTAVAKLQALVYDILPSTTAVFSYAIGSRKLSANEQFFVGAQTVVSLLQTTQIMSDVCFITDYVAYASSNKTKIV